MKQIHISLTRQKLTVYDTDTGYLCTYPISTAAAGNGECMGSYQTPRGRHKIRAKIGTGMPKNTIFVARRPTGESYTSELKAQYPDRDWILTRILWLCGCEPGKNRFGQVDTMRRYIYIHGVPDEADFSYRRSKGCINMRNDDIVELFDMIPIGTPVNIEE